jgi:hypothetical protein
LIVESMNVKENAMRDHVLLALKIQRGWGFVLVDTTQLSLWLEEREKHALTLFPYAVMNVSDSSHVESINA